MNEKRSACKMRLSAGIVCYTPETFLLFVGLMWGTSHMPEEIGELIYLVRSCKVMLDHDLAALYGVSTRVLIQAVKRNLQRFPTDFIFQLSIQEVRDLKSQIVTYRINSNRRSFHSRYLPPWST